MRFNDEYRKEMNSKKLSEDFIKNLAGKMAEESEKCQNQTADNDKSSIEVIETSAVEYRKNYSGIIRITVAAAAAAAVMICSVLSSVKTPEENISVTPVLPETVTLPPETVTLPEESETAESDYTNAETSQTEYTVITEFTETTDISKTEPSVSETVTEETMSEEESDDSGIYTENAFEIFEAFNTADSMRVGYGIETSDRPAFGYHVSDNEPDYEYIYVTDERFRSLSDISDFLNTYFTEDFIDSRFDLILKHRFREQDNGLYVTQTPTSYGYQWSSDEIKIQDKTENSFTMSRTYYDFGAESELILNMIKSDSYPGWKISSVKFSLLN